MTHIGTVRHGISEWPLFWSRYAPHRPALLYEDRTISWAELEDRASRIAGGLRRAGVRKGDRVGFLALNAPEFFEVLIGCARIGAIFVPFNIRLTAAEVEAMAEDAELSVFISETHFASHVDIVAKQLPAEALFFLDTPPEGGRSYTELLGDPVRDPSEVTLDDVAIFSFTSGTTGRSKAAMITHGNCAAVAIAVVNADGIDPSDRIVLPAPLAFAGSMLSNGMPFMFIGGSILIERRADPDRLLAGIERHRITRIKLVPAIYQMMAQHPDFETRDLSSLRSATSGGAPVPLDLLETYQARGVELGGAYGLTEGGGFNLLLPAHDVREKIGWTGLPLPFQDVRVVDPETGEQLPPHEVGELVIRGQCVMKGYWRAPEATAETIRDGWLHTGDMALADEHGYFKVVDRLKDMIISGGINVYPAEVERVLRQHPDVLDCAIVGVPDEKWGETPVACIVSRRSDLTLEDLAPIMNAELADYKRPRYLWLMDELPRNANGKVLKRDLRKDVVEVVERQRAASAQEA